MISEKEFKQKLIEKLNVLNDGWRDGDLDNFVGKKADIVNDKLKTIIEIKDDTKYKKVIPSISGKPVVYSTNITKKNRQFKDDLKDSSEKFIEYPNNYKSILLLRTEMAGSPKNIIEYTIRGPETFQKINGKLTFVGRPSTFFGDHDKSTKEVGAILFWGDNVFYRKNINPNVNKKRIIGKEELEKIFGINIFDLAN